jgi:putative ABC transport system permease protein
MKDNKNHKPPKLAIKLFKWYCRSDRSEELEGDLEEVYSNRLKNGSSVRIANLFFWWNVIRCFKSYSRNNTQNKLTTMSLYKSYFKLAFRHSWKNKVAVFINVLGLGIALSMCIAVYVIFAYNREFDTFYKNTNNIYRLHGITKEKGQIKRNEATPIAMEDRISNEISGIESVTSYFRKRVTVKNDNEYFSESAAVTSSNFFTFFDIPLLYGSFDQFGNQPVIFLTKNQSVKYFGDLVPIGKTLNIRLNSVKNYDVVIAGVFDKIPLNSSFEFDILINMNDYLNHLDIDKNDWDNKRNAGQYLKITNTHELERIEQSMMDYVPFQNKSQKEWKINRFELVPFSSPLLTQDQLNYSYVNARLRPELLLIFVVLVSLVLFTASFNMANTSMAMISNRLKEIGVRKTLGSANNQILIQFLFEMSIITSLAFIIALALGNFATGSLFGQFGAAFIMNDVSIAGVAVFVAIFLIITTFLAGLVPALYAWKFEPIAIMRKSVKLKGINGLNKALTIAQFSFSITVLFVGYTFSENTKYLDEFDYGYNMDNMFDLAMSSNAYYDAVKQEVDQIPGIETAGTNNHIGIYGNNRSIVKIDTSEHQITHYGIGENYLNLMRVELKEGRSFLKNSIAEKDNSIIVDQTFVDTFFKNKSPINQIIKLEGSRKTIVGVSNNVYDDLYSDSKKEPTVYSIASDSALTHLIVKVGNNENKTVETKLRDIWSKHIDKPYYGRLQKDIVNDRMRKTSEILKKIFLTMAVLGCFLSIVGIFSLASLTVAKRNKEMSIRKVLGATISELLLIINQSFSLILFLSLILGACLGYLVSDSVLSIIYKYYIDVSILSALLAGLLIIVISIFTITAAVLKPASANPINGLRDE